MGLLKAFSIVCELAVGDGKHISDSKLNIMNIITFQIVLSRQNAYDFHAPHKIVFLPIVITIVCRRMWILETSGGGGLADTSKVKRLLSLSLASGDRYNTV